MALRVSDEHTLRYFTLEHLEKAVPSQVMSSAKRYAIYLLPSATSRDDVSLSSKASSSTQYSGPESTVSIYSTSSASRSIKDSPAQDVVNRYRAGLPVESSVSRTSSMSEDADSALSETLNACVELDHTYCFVERDITFKYRQSSQIALEEAREEALSIARKCEAVGQKEIFCQRPGCHDKLRDAKALTCHLHIHNMTDAYEVYSVSNACHGTGCHFRVQVCHMPSKHCNIFPMKSIRRIISRIMSCR
ncbi:hypothetical protein AX17_006613 [Amanita inopinata Kibby_2008]|nr:hypothetical protein AX17_006613 [Amanita inopinata Kibby_2008]